MLLTLGGVLTAVGATVHGGGVVAFALLFLFRRRVALLDPVQLVRVYRAWGAGNGLSLAAWVYGLLLRWPLVVHPGAGLPEAYAPAESAVTNARALLIVALWVSYVVLEIWTLDPTRLMDRAGPPADAAAYGEAVARVGRHLLVNAALVLLIATLAGAGAGP